MILVEERQDHAEPAMHQAMHDAMVVPAGGLVAGLTKEALLQHQKMQAGGLNNRPRKHRGQHVSRHLSQQDSKKEQANAQLALLRTNVQLDQPNDLHTSNPREAEIESAGAPMSLSMALATAMSDQARHRGLREPCKVAPQSLSNLAGRASSVDVASTTAVAAPLAEIGLRVDSDGIARIVPGLDSDGIARIVPHGLDESDGIERRVSAGQSERLSGTSVAATGSGDSTFAAGSASNVGPGRAAAITVRHDEADGVALVERVLKALQEAKSVSESSHTRSQKKGPRAPGVAAVIDIPGDCAEAEPLLVGPGDAVTLRSSREDAHKVRIAIPCVKVSGGGSLTLVGIELCATEENSVKAGELRCTGCKITSRNGCGILVLHAAKLFLSSCEVVGCMRSGIGVNGKNAEIDLESCLISQNNFSGIGVNHQARSITLRGNQIIGNSYHGIWLNNGVVANWLGGDLSGNRMKDKDGPGTLLGYHRGDGVES